MKKFLPLLAVAMLCACTPNTSNPGNTSSSSDQSSSVSSAMSGTVTGTTFTDDIHNYAMNYPADFQVVANDNLVTEDYSVTGTSFVFPPSFASGNTLLEAKVTVALQPACPSISNTTASGATDVSMNGVTYEKSDWSGVGAGNLYQGTTYTTVHNDSCYILTLYMHSCNLGPDCYAGHTTPFAKKPLQDVFNTMVQSFKFL